MWKIILTEVMEIVDKYETLSTKPCEVCGKEGKLTGKRWVRTLSRIAENTPSSLRWR